MTKHYQK